MFPRLATIAEESESRCSSTTSLTRHGVEETSLVIAHKAALDADEGIAKIPAVVDDEFDGSHDRSLSFTNKTAVELESREEGSVPVHGYDDDINEVQEEAQLPITANEVKGEHTVKINSPQTIVLCCGARVSTGFIFMQ